MLIVENNVSASARIWPSGVNWSVLRKSPTKFQFPHSIVCVALRFEDSTTLELGGIRNPKGTNGADSVESALKESTLKKSLVLGSENSLVSNLIAGSGSHR